MFVLFIITKSRKITILGIFLANKGIILVKGVIILKKHNPQNTSEEGILKDDENFVYDKEPESYDTVLDEITGNEEEEENVEAEYEGYTEEELDDEPPL